MARTGPIFRYQRELTEKQRRVGELFGQGLTIDEIATRVGVRRDVIMQRLNVCRSNLLLPTLDAVRRHFAAKPVVGPRE